MNTEKERDAFYSLIRCTWPTEKTDKIKIIKQVRPSVGNIRNFVKYIRVHCTVRNVLTNRKL